ncbi:MAG: TonB-dependent receptor, partial [Verrucomicrobiae bacterium]|nr:TonB-dependent receptor [Verrucomicrobiae bacterium]
VLVQKTANGQGSPFIRGFTGYRTLALVDGIRVNNSVFRDGPNQYWNTIDPYGLGSVELVRGQGSVQYGSDAIGGTINALTRRPRYSDEEGGLLTGGRLFGRYASAEDSYTGRVEANVSESDRYGFLFGFTGKDYGDLRSAGIGRQPKTGYDEWDVDAKLELFLNPDTRLTFFHQQVRIDDAWRTHRTEFARSFRGTEIGDEQRRSLDQDRMLSYVQLDGDLDGFIDHYLFSVSHQRQEEEQFRVRKRGDGRRDLQGFTVDTLGAIAQFTSDSELGTWTWGADYYRDWVESFNNSYAPDGSLTKRSIQGPVADDSTYDLASAFVQDHLEIGDRLDLWLGGRFTYARAELGRFEDPLTGEASSGTDDWTNGVGSARFVYDLDSEASYGLFGGASQGFRAPNLSDLSRFDTARSDEIETPSTGLTPEKYTSFELGLRQNIGRFQGQLAYFYTDIRDQITGRRTGRVIDGDYEITKVNASDGYVHGFEFEGSYDLSDQFSLFGWAAWQDGSIETYPSADAELTNEPISRLLPFSAEAGVRWTHPEERFWMELAALGATEQDRLAQRDTTDTQRIPPGGTPGYVIGILRAGWELKDGFSLTAGVENFTNEAYRVHGSGLNAPGRNFILSAEWRF